MEERTIEAETLEIDLRQLGALLARNRRLLLAGVGVSLLLGLLIAFLAYHDKYKAEATVILNPIDIPNILTNYRNSNNFFQGFSPRSNPEKNQEELLKSRKLASKVSLALREDARRGGIRLRGPLPNAEKLTQMLGVKQSPASDFIRISVTSPYRDDAPVIARKFIEVYERESLDISREPLLQQKQTLSAQRNATRAQLDALETQIRQYQEANNIVDLETRSRVLVQKLEALNSSYKDVTATLGEKRAEAARLQAQLKLDAVSGLRSVAIGQDALMTDLQSQLYKAQNEYDLQALTFSPTNPDMRRLGEKIAVLKEQTRDARIRTVGLSGARMKTPMAIHDPIRADLVSRLAVRDAEASALSSKAGILAEQERQSRSELAQLPRTQLEFAKLLLQKRNLEEILTRLDAKLTEVDIQFTGLSAVIQRVDDPATPDFPVFPSRLHILALVTLLGSALSCAAILLVKSRRQWGLNARALENAAGASALSTIPWVSQAYWDRLRQRHTLETLATPSHQPTVKAYQRLALNLKVDRQQTGRNALVLAATEETSAQSVVLANVAYCLAQGGQRVVMVDARLQHPVLHETLGHALCYEQGLSELVNDLAEAAHRDPDVSPETLWPLIERALTPSDIHPDLLYLNAGVALENTFAFLNSPALALLAKTLKSRFDWALFDAAPLLSGPDACILLNATDGLLLLVEQRARQEQIAAAARQVAQIHGEIVGLVLREETR
ncbi:MAG: hypothetical protein IPK79_02935 [Vampirovibrionales bacterium]|nr:hypothetical protein [Vampirovibrionales bacterium]